MVEKLTKKQKKTSEFRTKKRKLDDSIPDVPEEDTAENAAKDESKKEETKAKKQKTDAKDTTSAETTDATSTDGKKKRRRGKGASKEGETEAVETATEGETKDAPKPKPVNQKFIVFVGGSSLSRRHEDMKVALDARFGLLRSNTRSLFYLLHRQPSFQHYQGAVAEAL